MKRETARASIKRDLVLCAAIVALVIALFFAFSKQNHARILRQNQSYVEDNAKQTADRLDEMLQSALMSVQQMAYWYAQTLDAPQITPRDLQEMTEHSDFDYVRFADAQGINYAADGRTNNAADREYYLAGMEGDSGISVIMSSRITSETLINFYAPLRYKGQVFGVLRGVYLADKRMKELLNTSFFGVPSATFLCARDGSIIACSEALWGAHLQPLWAEESGTKYVSDSDMERIRTAFSEGAQLSFLYDLGGGNTGTGYITPLGQADMMLVQTFPGEVTGSMYRSAVSAGMKLEASLVCLFAAYILIMVVRTRRQRRRLLR